MDSITLTKQLKTIQIIHFALCLGVIVFYAILGEFSMDQLTLENIDSESLVYLAIPIVAIALSEFQYKQLLNQADPNLKLEENLGKYQTASIVRWAILEGAALLLLVLVPQFTILGVLLLLYLIYVRPTESRAKKDLNYLY